MDLFLLRRKKKKEYKNSDFKSVPSLKCVRIKMKEIKLKCLLKLFNENTMTDWCTHCSVKNTAYNVRLSEIFTSTVEGE